MLGYASRILSRTEQNYDVTRRELLAVVYGLKTYRQYLLGRQFVIRSDHSALQSLRRTAEPIGQQPRWQTFIEQFSFVIMHRPGTRHRNADALSRKPFVEENDSDRQARVQCAKSKVSKNQQSAQNLSQASAGEVCQSSNNKTQILVPYYDFVSNKSISHNLRKFSRVQSMVNETGNRNRILEMCKFRIRFSLVHCGRITSVTRDGFRQILHAVQKYDGFYVRCF